MQGSRNLCLLNMIHSHLLVIDVYLGYRTSSDHIFCKVMRAVFMCKPILYIAMNN